MREHDYFYCEEDDPWEGVRLTKEAIRARATLMLYTTLVSAPFVAMVAFGSFLCGLEPHEVLGVSLYNTMVSSIFFFDTLRNASHDCFEKAQAEGLVTLNGKGIPILDPTCPHRRLARLSFAIRGRVVRKRP